MSENNQELWDGAVAAESPTPSKPRFGGGGSGEPAWRRRFPRRMWVLAGVAALSVVLYWVFQSSVALSPANADPTAFLAPWRYAMLANLFLWVGILSGVSSLWVWLLHVRDRENLVRTLEAQARFGKTGRSQ